VLDDPPADVGLLVLRGEGQLALRSAAGRDLVRVRLRVRVRVRLRVRLRVTGLTLTLIRTLTLTLTGPRPPAAGRPRWR